METPFDTLQYYEDLKAADVPENQARAQAEALRSALAAYDANRVRELVTKGDLRKTEACLQKEMREIEWRLLKWQFGIAFVLAAIMAKGLAGSALDTFRPPFGCINNQEFVKKGILEESTGNAWGRIYMFGKYLRLFTEEKIKIS